MITKTCQYCGPIKVSCMHLREELVIGIQPGAPNSVITFSSDQTHSVERVQKVLKEFKDKINSDTALESSAKKIQANMEPLREKGYEKLNTDLKMQYLGVLNLLAENAVFMPNDKEEERDCIEQAFRDAEELIPTFKWKRILQSYQVWID